MIHFMIGVLSIASVLSFAGGHLPRITPLLQPHLQRKEAMPGGWLYSSRHGSAQI